MQAHEQTKYMIRFHPFLFTEHVTFFFPPFSRLILCGDYGLPVFLFACLLPFVTWPDTLLLSPGMHARRLLEHCIL